MLQYINASEKHAVHFKFIQCYVSDLSSKKRGLNLTTTHTITGSYYNPVGRMDSYDLFLN